MSIKTLVVGAALGLAATFGINAAQAADLYEEPVRGMRYIPSVSNPLFNESPFITTEIRPIYIHHDIPESFVTDGGNVDLIALQARYAITDRLALIATKDGYADVDFDSVLPDTDGFANITAGLKYNLIRDEENMFMLTAGLRYEIPLGSIKTAGIKLQGGGDGFISGFVTAAKQWDKLQVQGSANVNLALDGDHDSSMFVLALHADYELLPNFYPLVEFNMFSVIDKGNRLPFNFEGYDVFNFGNVDAGTVASIAAGARYRFNDNILLGAAFEIPVTDRKDVTDWRLTTDMVLHF